MRVYGPPTGPLFLAPTPNIFMSLLIENYLNILFLPTNVVFDVQMIIIVTKTSKMSLSKCKNVFQIPSNINSDIKNKIKKKYFQPTDPNFFSACDSKHTYIYIFFLPYPDRTRDKEVMARTRCEKTDRQTDGRMDERTDRQCDSYIPPKFCLQGV